MEIIKHDLSELTIKYPLEKHAALSDILFIDIETTGFTAQNSKLYLIGGVYYSDNTWKAIQFFADDYSDEKLILEEFTSFASGFTTLIHFNGNNFDIPYLNYKIGEYGLEADLSEFKGIDIYRRVAPLKDFLKIENCKQKTVESFLGISREDKYSGGDLIGIYHDYVKDKDAEKKKLLWLHNYEDIIGMPDILPILYYSDLFNELIVVNKVSANHFTTMNGSDSSELIMDFVLDYELPIPVSSFYDGIYITIKGNKGMLRVPIFEGELKYFFANYKDYYYLPNEDTALHKSVASYVDKSRRVQAKAATCYTKKEARFLPQWDDMIIPFFKEDYESKKLYFELTDERKTDRELFSNYATHLIAHISKLL